MSLKRFEVWVRPDQVGDLDWCDKREITEETEHVAQLWVITSPDAADGSKLLFAGHPAFKPDAIGRMIKGKFPQLKTFTMQQFKEGGFIFHHHEGNYVESMATYNQDGELL